MRDPVCEQDKRPVSGLATWAACSAEKKGSQPRNNPPDRTRWDWNKNAPVRFCHATNQSVRLTSQNGRAFSTCLGLVRHPVRRGRACVWVRRAWRGLVNIGQRVSPLGLVGWRWAQQVILRP
jgi:hypothetical protein